MKKIFFLLITFLSYSLLLNMKIVHNNRKKTMQSFMYNAKKAEKNNNTSEAFEWYGKVADTGLPPQTKKYINPIKTKKDPYFVQRKCQEQAFNKIAQKALALNEQGKHNEALQIYQCAPRSFPNHIEALKMMLDYQAKKQKNISLDDQL